MIRLDCETPRAAWTFDYLEDLKEQRETFGDAVWKESLVTSYVIRKAEIRFDPPDDDWGHGAGSTIAFRRHGDGIYIASGNGYTYEAVRADTPRGVILTGRWVEDGAGTGVFIVTLPHTEASHRAR